MKINLNALNIGKKKTPNGYYLIVTGVEIFQKIKNYITSHNFKYEIVGSEVFIYTKSRKEIQQLIQYAKKLNIQILSRD